eukprot:4569012-Pleurochrysis_carterae.AAC.1
MLLVTRKEFRQCALQSVMPYHVRYKHVCNPNGASAMRVTKCDALPWGLQASLKPEWRSYNASYKRDAVQ